MMGNKSKYGILFLRVILLLIAILSFNHYFAQDVYRTQNGNVLITAVSSDSIFTFVSKDVEIYLNNSQATFTMTIDKSTLKSGNKRIDEELILMKSDEIVISGELGVENIGNNDHSPLDFDLEGVISTNNKIVLGRGRLEHLSPEGNIACLLTLNFIINKDDLGLNLEGLDLSDEVQLDIVQVLLNN